MSEPYISSVTVLLLNTDKNWIFITSVQKYTAMVLQLEHGIFPNQVMARERLMGWEVHWSRQLTSWPVYSMTLAVPSYYDVLSATKSNILLFCVAAADVHDTTASVPLTVPVIPGTMSIHQVLCINYGHIKYCNVSCFCSSDKVSCVCYEVKDFTFTALETKNSFGMSCNTEWAKRHNQTKTK